MSAVATDAEAWNAETVTARCVNTGPAAIRTGRVGVKADCARLGSPFDFKDCRSAPIFQAPSRDRRVNFRAMPAGRVRSQSGAMTMPARKKTEIPFSILLERFWDKVMPEPNSGCWLWTGSENGKGYGQLWDGHRASYAHRFSYEAFVGAIPAGLHLDHKCRNPSCVNPGHLEAVTPAENQYRGIGPFAANRRKTHCVNGHELSGDNLRVVVWGARSQPRRVCMACGIAKEARRRGAAS